MILCKTSILLLIVIVIAGIGCKQSRISRAPSKNDTSEIFRLLIDSGLQKKSFANFDKLKTYSPFGDSIVLTVDSTLLKYLPKSFTGKVLSLDSICLVAKANFQDTSKFWSFLRIQDFSKFDGFYEVNLVNFGVMSLYDRHGKRVFKDGVYKKFPKIDCIIGYKCSDVMRMQFIKEGDSLAAKITGVWSDQ
jgi:hypothetical protein